MKPPYFLNESPRPDLRGDLSLFESENELLSYVEPVDVENGEYFAFDAEGRLLSLTVHNGQVRLSDGEAEPRHADVLARLLRENLASLEIPDDWPAASHSWLRDAELNDLVAHTVEVDHIWRSQQAGGRTDRAVRQPSSSAARRG